MISHKHKCIFIHIPKTGGSSITRYLTNKNFDWKEADYEYLYGWCPKRKVHLQHATQKQMLETGLVTQEEWNTYFKFTFVRNPWDRVYSDYLWLQKTTGIEDSFENFLKGEGEFCKVMSDKNVKQYRGDHTLAQKDFFDFVDMDFVGRFENFKADVETVRQKLGIKEQFGLHEKENKVRRKDYRDFYNDDSEQLIATLYKKDIDFFDYSF